MARAQQREALAARAPHVSSGDARERRFRRDRDRFNNRGGGDAPMRAKAVHGGSAAAGAETVHNQLAELLRFSGWRRESFNDVADDLSVS